MMDAIPPEADAALLAEQDGRDAPPAKIIRPNFGAAVAVPPFQLVGPAQGLWSPLEPITYAVGGLVPAASLVLVSGYSSSLKSWLAIEMAFARASGRPWLEHEPFATERGAVTYMDREAGLYEIRRRLHAIRRPLDLVEDPLLDVCSFPAGGNIFAPEFKRRLTELAAERSMVFLDTLAAFAYGVDENTAAMAEGLGNLAEVVDATKCTIVVVAHEKKKGSNGGDIDPRERVRGNSAIFGSVDCVFSCQRDKPRQPVNVEQTKGRNGREAEPFVVSMLDAPSGGVTFTVATKTEPRALTPTEQVDQIVEDIVAAVVDAPRCSGKYLRGAITGRGAKIDAALERALATGRVRNIGTTALPQYVAEVRR